jgi:N6-L-threonylcarbamoyladenine synthase
MLALAIETSCDETSLAFLKYEVTGEFVSTVQSIQEVSQIISSQIEVHKEYGGVVPEIGARLHAQQIHFLLRQLLSQTLHCDVSGQQLSSIELEYLSKLDTIFVTTEPGLSTALQVGKEFALSLAHYLGKKDIVQPVNHLRGHVASSFWSAREQLNNQVFPHLHYLVSGGNTQLILFESWSKWQIIGQTLDDAAGECLDKIGRMLGLPYPAAVSIAKIAGLLEENRVHLPTPMKDRSVLDVSNSGLKTAARHIVEKHPELVFEQRLTEEEISLLIAGTQLNPKLQVIQDICISAQYVVIDQLYRKMKAGIKLHQPASIGISGGVSANRLLRKKLEKFDIPFFIPDMRLTGDNATMIGIAGILDTKS